MQGMPPCVAIAINGMLCLSGTQLAKRSRPEGQFRSSGRLPFVPKFCELVVLPKTSFAICARNYLYTVLHML